MPPPPDQLKLALAAWAQLRFWINKVLPVNVGELRDLSKKLRK